MTGVWNHFQTRMDRLDQDKGRFYLSSRTRVKSVFSMEVHSIENKELSRSA